MAKNNKSCSQSKHIDIKCLTIREPIKDKKVSIPIHIDIKYLAYQ